MPQHFLITLWKVKLKTFKQMEADSDILNTVGLSEFKRTEEYGKTRGTHSHLPHSSSLQPTPQPQPLVQNPSPAVKLSVCL